MLAVWESGVRHLLVATATAAELSRTGDLQSGELAEEDVGDEAFAAAGVEEGRRGAFAILPTMTR